VVVRFSVFGALLQVGLGHDAYELIGQVVSAPAGTMTWLRATERIKRHVLDAFTTAIQRAKKMGAT
jgi:hypothetical protein